MTVWLTFTHPPNSSNLCLHQHCQLLCFMPGQCVSWLQVRFLFQCNSSCGKQPSQHAFEFSNQFSSVQSLSESDSLWPMDWSRPGIPVHHHSRACWISCPSSLWCHPTISSSVIPFFSCLQSFPASESFQMSQHFASGGQSIGVSASASVLPMNIQDWFPLGFTGLIFLQCKGLFKSLLQHHSSKASTLWCSVFFMVQLSHTWVLEKP